MQILKLQPQDDGKYLIIQGTTVPEGWAYIPEDLPVPVTIPYIEIDTAMVDGMMTVTDMRPATVPDNFSPSEDASNISKFSFFEDMENMLVDLEYRMALLELGGE